MYIRLSVEYVWWMLIWNIPTSFPFFITSYEEILLTCEVHNPDLWGYANLCFPYISWKTRRIFCPKKNTIWPCNKIEIPAFQTMWRYCFYSTSLVSCTQIFKALFATAQAEKKYAVKSHKEEQICSNWLLWFFSHMFL